MQSGSISIVSVQSDKLTKLFGSGNQRENGHSWNTLTELKSCVCTTMVDLVTPSHCTRKPELPKEEVLLSDLKDIMVKVGGGGGLMVSEATTVHSLVAQTPRSSRRNLVGTSENQSSLRNTIVVLFSTALNLRCSVFLVGGFWLCEYLCECDGGVPAKER